MGRIWVYRSAIARAACVTVIYVGAVAIYLGGGAIAALVSLIWHPLLFNADFIWGWAMAANLVLLVTVLGTLEMFAHGTLTGRFGICLLAVTFALVSAVVFSCVVRTAVALQVMRDWGVTQTAVVTTQYVYVPTGGPGPGDPDTYSYALRALTGPPIRGDLQWSKQHLDIGEHVTVRAEPDGLVAPTLNVHRSPDREWQATLWTGAITAALLAVVAGTASRPPRLRKDDDLGGGSPGDQSYRPV